MSQSLKVQLNCLKLVCSSLLSSFQFRACQMANDDNKVCIFNALLEQVPGSCVKYEIPFAQMVNSIVRTYAKCKGYCHCSLIILLRKRSVLSTLSKKMVFTLYCYEKIWVIHTLKGLFSFLKHLLVVFFQKLGIIVDKYDNGCYWSSNPQSRFFVIKILSVLYCN